MSLALALSLSLTEDSRRSRHAATEGIALEGGVNRDSSTRHVEDADEMQLRAAIAASLQSPAARAGGRAEGSDTGIADTSIVTSSRPVPPRMDAH